MSAGSDGYIEFVKEQMASLGGLSTTRFFGGVGLCSDGVQFAMIMGGTLYFVVNDSTRPAYENLGSSCFSYETRKGRVEVRKYYAVPAELIEDEEQLVALAREAVGIAAGTIRSARPRHSSS